MNELFSTKQNARKWTRLAALAMTGTAGFLLSAGNAAAQTTNAYDVAADAAYTGAGGPNGLSPGGQNGGYGFSPWTFTVNGNGGAFLSGTGPSGASWDLWNTAAGGTTVAMRPFSSPLVAGQSFSAKLRLNSLDNSGTTNAMILQDASGKTLFMYWHTGYEPNNAVNGHYTDAATTNGAAVNFRYDYQQFDSFTFTLNSASTYTFTDNTTGGTVSGVVDGSIAQVAFFRGSAGSTGGGQDFQFDELVITTAAVVAPLTFSQVTPTPGSYSAPVTNAISALVVPGGASVSSSGVSMQVDGVTVTPTITTGVGGILSVNYQPPTSLSAGTVHTARLVAVDSTSTRFTNDWTFTTGFSALPAVLPGPFAISNGNNDFLIFTAEGDPWLGTNYGTESRRTLYTRFSMAFQDLNGETGSGGGYGGLHFFQDNDARLLLGNGWTSLNWSLDAAATQVDLSPALPVVLNEWHTILVRMDYTPGANATATMWLDPDFTVTEAEQANAPVQMTLNGTFNEIRLRCGNGTAQATFTNVMVAATADGVGLKKAAGPTFQGFLPVSNAPSASVKASIGAEIVFGTYGIGTNKVNLTLDGAAVTPAFTVTPISIVLSYQPATPFAASSVHTVEISLTDSNNAAYSTSWSFTVDAYPTLPVTVAGPIDVTGGGEGITIFSNLNGWLDSNYQSTSTNTLYTRFSMVFYDINGESADGAGGCFGGLHFFQDGNERLLIGETWVRNSWSVDEKKGGDAGEPSLVPTTTVVPGEWHTMVARCVYASGADATVDVWLDPDFSKTLGNQPQSSLSFTMDNRFNSIHLRCGNGSAYAQFTNVVLAATASGVGFPEQPVQAKLTIVRAGTSATLSWTSTGTLMEAPSVNGPWSVSANQSTPQTVDTTQAARFYRLRQ
jgi:hypothetical protein